MMTIRLLFSKGLDVLLFVGLEVSWHDQGVRGRSRQLEVDVNDYSPETAISELAHSSDKRLHLDAACSGFVH